MTPDEIRQTLVDAVRAVGHEPLSRRIRRLALAGEPIDDLLAER